MTVEYKHMQYVEILYVLNVKLRLLIPVIGAIMKGLFSISIHGITSTIRSTPFLLSDFNMLMLNCGSLVDKFVRAPILNKLQYCMLLISAEYKQKIGGFIIAKYA